MGSDPILGLWEICNCIADTIWDPDEFFTIHDHFWYNDLVGWRPSQTGCSLTASPINV